MQAVPRMAFYPTKKQNVLCNAKRLCPLFMEKKGANAAMERLKKYCLPMCDINGLDTYVISPAQQDSLLANQEFLNELNGSSPIIATILLHFIQIAKNIGAGMLYPAFVHHKNRKRFAWEPVLCYENEGAFYHVFYRDSWMCRECGYKLFAPILMPSCEADSIFYSGTENRFPATLPFFRKIPCPACGKLLQNHLLILDC